MSLFGQQLYAKAGKRCLFEVEAVTELGQFLEALSGPESLCFCG